MEKRNLYIIVAIVLVVGLVLSFTGLTGRVALGGCKDSDDGDKPRIAGTVKYGGIEYKDECYSTTGKEIEKWLKEKYCLDKAATQRYFCENGCLKDKNGLGYCAEGEIRKLA